MNTFSKDREAFEAAYAATVVEACGDKGLTATLATMVQVMIDSRVDEESYLFNFAHIEPIDNILTTGMVNSAWWAWREAQRQILETTGSAGHVVH